MVKKQNKEEEDPKGIHIYPPTYNPRVCPRVCPYSASSGVSGGEITNAS
jgi:hypothetical protein